LVLVDVDAGVLCLCRDGRAEREYRVAIGRGGTGKQREGDGRTPLGRYPLGGARDSRLYHLFLPVGYPTSQQSQRGYTGSAIGVHGPHLAFAWLGHATVWPDWTLGCVALGTWTQIGEVAGWVAQNQVRTIELAQGARRP
jgi:murein L,D-transpeptidase YafK